VVSVLSREVELDLVVDVASIGVILILIGFGVLLVAALWSSKGQKGQAKVRGGGVLLIGPIPIIFGSDAKWAIVAIVLAIALILMVFLFSPYRW
jgi:uncharacterized protein (TIGR00304 family)